MIDPKRGIEQNLFSKKFENLLNSTSYKVDIDISIFGLRNLNYSANNPKISVRLTSGL
jgi:hypothetical protein